MNHPAHDELWALLESENKKEAEDSPSLKGLKLILAAWARLEDEASGDELTNLQDIRLSWGKIARDFLHIGKENK